jgi:hypothetical protein
MPTLSLYNGDLVTLTAARSGNSINTTWSWARPAGASVANSAAAVLSWNFNSATDAGDYTVTATSSGSSDSPQTATITLAALDTVVD